MKITERQLHGAGMAIEGNQIVRSDEGKDFGVRLHFAATKKMFPEIGAELESMLVKQEGLAAILCYMARDSKVIPQEQVSKIFDEFTDSTARLRRFFQIPEHSE